MKEEICSWSCLELDFFVQMWLSTRYPRIFFTVSTVSDNLRAVYSSNVDGRKLYEKILDCKMLD